MALRRERHLRSGKPPQGRGLGLRVLICAALVGLAAFTAYQTGALNMLCRSRAKSALARLQWDRAEGWLRRASSLASDKETEFLWARLDRKLGRLDEMNSHLKRSRALGGDAERLQLELVLAKAEGGELADLESQLPRLLAEGKEPGEVAESYVLGCLQAYRLDAALELLDVWQADSPRDPRPPFLRGRIFEHQGGLNASEEQYRAALQCEPEYAPAAYSLGRVLLAKQQPDAALQFCEVAAAHGYDPQPGLIGAARCLREQERFAEARARLEQAGKSPPDRIAVAFRLVGESGEAAAAHLATEWGHLELSQKNWEAAEKWFAQALATNPRDWRTRYSYAIALRQQHKTEAASREMEVYTTTKEQLATCDRLIDELQSDPSNVEARFQVAKVLLESVSQQQGVVWLQSVLDYDPNHAGAHRLLAEYYERHVDRNPDFARLAELHRAAVNQTVGPSVGDE